MATEDSNYSFLYQLTHITKDRGALTYDDRVDAVAGAGAHFQRHDDGRRPGGQGNEG